MIKKITKSLLLFLILSFFSNQIHAQSVGGVTTGAKDFCSTTNSGFVSVTGYKTTILFWQTSTDGGITWVNNSNKLPNQTYFNLAQTTCFRAVVQDGAFPPDTSTQVCITIYKPAEAGTIIGGGTFCASAPAGILSVTGNIGTVAYWQYSETNGTTWINIPNSTTTENYPSLTKDRLYRVIVENGAACKKDTSATVAFVISQSTVAGSIAGATNVCAVNNNGTLTVSGNTGAILGWQSSINSGASWQPISNTTTSQSYLNLTVTTWYRAIVKNGGCATDTTATAVINVSPVTIPGNLTGGGSFCGNIASGTLILSGNNGTIQYWVTSVDSGATWMQLSNISNTYNYSNVPVTTWYGVVSKSGGCPADTSQIAKVNVAAQTVAGTLGADKSICYAAGPDTLRLTGKIGDVLNWLQSTNSGTTWKVISNKTDSLIYSGLTQTTWYTAIVKSGQCQTDTAIAIKITVFPKTPVDAGVWATITEGQSVTLTGSGNGIPEWTPATGLSDAFIFNPIAKPEETTTYTLSLTDVNNCISTDTVTINVLKLKYDGKITNLFTPNDDGVNDTWYIQDIQRFPDNEVFVYNIYGQEVFTKKGYMNDWKGTYNGSELPDGTYYYVLKFENSDVVFKGSVDILRNK